VLALRAALTRLAIGASPASLFAVLPQLHFRCERESCPHCGAELKVWKTQTRRPSTLHLGRFVAHETVLYCDRCADSPVFRSAELAALVGPNRTFGYDIMVFVGEEVLRRCRTAGETAAELARRNVTISPSEVRELVARFVVSLGIAHAEAAPRLRQCLQTAGGYILHLDSTCKGGSAHLLTGIDEVSGFVLLNAKVTSESADEIGAFLRDLRRRFGVPAAVSCDMSRGILAAVAAEFAGTPVFICHFHFLRDLGKDLMGQDYDTIRKRLRLHGVKAELRRLQRELRDVVSAHAEPLEKLLHAIENDRADAGLVRALPCTAVIGAFVAAVLDAEHQGDGCGFPFDRPHLLFFRQAQTVSTAANSLYRAAPLQPHERQLCKRLVELLLPVCADPALAAAADAVEDRAKVFDHLRRAMRIAEPGSGQGLNDAGANVPITTIERNVDRFCEPLRTDRTLMARDECRTMLAQIDTYRRMLFADPIRVQTPQGSRTLQPQRTNNILERFFRGLNRQGCKRTGRRPGEAYLNRVLPDTPLVANLDNPRYREVLLDGCDSLTGRLSRVDPKLVDATLVDLRKSQTGLSRALRARLRARPTPLQIACFILTNAA
jgi:hypothetical protein